MVNASAITLRQLRAFVAVAQEGSIVRAAQRLHLTASALSMLISTLEGEVGMRLFERTTRRMVLTDAGQALLPAMTQVFSHLDDALGNLEQLTLQRASFLRIATSPLMAATMIPPLLAGFRVRHPNVRLSLIDVSVDEVAQAVRNGEADIGICTEDVNALDLQARSLYQDRLVLACLESHPLASRQEVRWSELAGEQLVLMRRNTGLRKLAERGLSATGDLAQAPFEVANVTTAVGMVEAGLGVSILPSYALTRTRAVGVRSIPLTEPVISRAIVALNAPERPLSGAAEAFLAHAQQSALWGPVEEAKRRPRARKAPG